jgi:cellulose biosynthesis protein BcsQ
VPASAKVFSIVNQKGGACKTTTTLNLAAALAATGARVLVIDADPESHSASDWSAVRGEQNPPPFKLISMPQPILHRDVPGLAVDYDFVVIDGPPQSSPITKSAIAAADLVIIPVQPSGADHRAARSAPSCFPTVILQFPNRSAQQSTTPFGPLRFILFMRAMRQLSSSLS